ncbi:MAG UNVERIFIED_CONTAM: ADP-ribosylglycohydrolase family protein [Planctomycetaceae bacterium]|jgi:hypothetical protein
MHGEDRSAVLSPDWPSLEQLHRAAPLHPLILEVAKGSFRSRQPPVIKGSGWVVKSLEAALWAFHDAGDFREAVLRAVNLGDDADTTGAICGQFAGAYWGESAIPEDLLRGTCPLGHAGKGADGNPHALNRVDVNFFVFGDRCPSRDAARPLSRLAGAQWP